MNTAPPEKGTRRWHAERFIWGADLVRYLAFIIVGLGFAMSPTPVVQHTIGEYEALAWIIPALFIAGGVWGLVVRLLRLSLFEMPAIWITCGALGTYLSLCVWAVVGGYGGGVIGGAYAIAFLALFVRRIVELQALTSQPRK